MQIVSILKCLYPYGNMYAIIGFTTFIESLREQELLKDTDNILYFKSN